MSAELTINLQERLLLGHKLAHKNLSPQSDLKRDVMINWPHVKMALKKRQEGHMNDHEKEQRNDGFVFNCI